jgi:hypothetical protein
MPAWATGLLAGLTAAALLLAAVVIAAAIAYWRT